MLLFHRQARIFDLAVVWKSRSYSLFRPSFLSASLLLMVGREGERKTLTACLIIVSNGNVRRFVEYLLSYLLIHRKINKRWIQEGERKGVRDCYERINRALLINHRL